MSRHFFTGGIDAERRPAAVLPVRPGRSSEHWHVRASTTRRRPRRGSPTWTGPARPRSCRSSRPPTVRRSAQVVGVLARLLHVVRRALGLPRRRGMARLALPVPTSLTGLQRSPSPCSSRGVIAAVAHVRAPQLSVLAARLAPSPGGHAFARRHPAECRCHRPPVRPDGRAPSPSFTSCVRRRTQYRAGRTSRRVRPATRASRAPREPAEEVQVALMNLGVDAIPRRRLRRRRGSYLRVIELVQDSGRPLTTSDSRVRMRASRRPTTPASATTSRS